MEATDSVENSGHITVSDVYPAGLRPQSGVYGGQCRRVSRLWFLTFSESPLASDVTDKAGLFMVHSRSRTLERCPKDRPWFVSGGFPLRARLGASVAPFPTSATSRACPSWLIINVDRSRGSSTSNHLHGCEKPTEGASIAFLSRHYTKTGSAASVRKLRTSRRERSRSVNCSRDAASNERF